MIPLLFGVQPYLLFSQTVKLVANEKKNDFRNVNGSVMYSQNRGYFLQTDKIFNEVKILDVALSFDPARSDSLKSYDLLGSFDLSPIFLKNENMRTGEHSKLICLSADKKWLVFSVEVLSSAKKPNSANHLILFDLEKKIIRFRKEFTNYGNNFSELNVGFHNDALLISNHIFQEKIDPFRGVANWCLEKVEWSRYDLKTDKYFRNLSFDGEPVLTSGSTDLEILERFNKSNLERINLLQSNVKVSKKSDSLFLIGKNSLRFGGCKNIEIEFCNNMHYLSFDHDLGKGKVIVYDGISYPQISDDRFFIIMNGNQLVNLFRVEKGNVGFDSLVSYDRFKIEWNLKRKNGYFYDGYENEEVGFYSQFKSDRIFLVDVGRARILVDPEMRRIEKIKTTTSDLIYPLTQSEKTSVKFLSYKYSNGSKIKYFINNKVIYKREYSLAMPAKTVGSDQIQITDLHPKFELSRDDKYVYIFNNLSTNSWNSIQCRGRDGKLIWENKRYSEFGCKFKLSLDDKILAAFMPNFNIDFLNASNGSKFLSLIVDTSSFDWVLFTPSGYYDCSPNGERLISWSISKGPDSLPASYPVEFFRKKFFRPDVVDSTLKYLSEKKALKLLSLGSVTNTYNFISRTLPPEIFIDSPGINDFFSDSIVSIRYSLKAGSSAISSIKIFLDGRPWRTIIPQKGKNRIEVIVPPKDLTIGLVAVSGLGESEMAFCRLVWRGQKPKANSFTKPNLYVLGFGVSQYQLEHLKLDLPGKDARDFCNFFRTQQGKLFNTVNIKLLIDSSASKKNILAGLEWLERSVTNRDVSIIFLAGHGENDNNSNFYFLPYEADPDRMKSTCVPYFDFKATITSLPGKVLVFADACRSGNLFGDLTRRATDLDFLARELASGNGGAVVFTSSGRKQASIEKKEWGNGAFTKAVIEGLSGKADFFNEGYITVKSLDVYISRRVKELTGGRQSPHLIIPESISDFPVAVKE